MTGLKVSMPTSSSTVAQPMPRSRKRAISSSVKCRPAVGAAAEDSFTA